MEVFEKHRFFGFGLIFACFHHNERFHYFGKCRQIIKEEYPLKDFLSFKCVSKYNKDYKCSKYTSISLNKSHFMFVRVGFVFKQNVLYLYI